MSGRRAKQGRRLVRLWDEDAGRPPLAKIHPRGRRYVRRVRELDERRTERQAPHRPVPELHGWRSQRHNGKRERARRGRQGCHER